MLADGHPAASEADFLLFSGVVGVLDVEDGGGWLSGGRHGV